MNLSKLLGSCLLLLGLFAVTTALAADPPGEAEGQKHFAAGLAYIDDPSGPKIEEAYREFHAAYAALPSYKILSNIGYCALHLERDAEAIDMYRRFLANATTKEMTPRERKQMETDIKTLSASLVTVTLQTAPEQVTIIDERFPSKGPARVNRYPVTGGRQDLGIHPGNHKITATAEGYEPQSWEFEAGPATNHNHAFKLAPVGGEKPVALADPAKPTAPATPNSAAGAPSQAARAVTAPPETPSKRTPTLVYVGAAATGVFAVTATVTGLLAQSKKSDLVDFNQDGLHPQEAQSARDSAKRYALFTDISLGAAILSAGATAYFYFSAPAGTTEASARTSDASAGTSRSPARAARAAETRASWSIAPGFGSGQANVILSGKF